MQLKGPCNAKYTHKSTQVHLTFMKHHPSIEYIHGGCAEPSLRAEPFYESFSSKGERILHAMLLKERTRFSKLEADINRLESMLGDLREKRENCVIRMNEYSTALSPHKHLPPEVLSTIFVFCMENQPTSLPPRHSDLPWVLLRVCSRWRQIALAEHRIWNRLNIVGSQVESGDSAISALIPRLWGRTQMFPVSLNLVASDDNIALHNVLLPYFQRVRSLSLHMSAKSLARFLISPPAPFESLNSLVLNFSFGVPSNFRLLPNVDGPLPSVFTTSPRLREVTFTANTINAINFHAGISCLPWPQLTHLTFHMVRVGLCTIESILRQCAQLISLTFTSLNEEYEPSLLPSIPEIPLPKLRSITLISDNSIFASSIFEVLKVPSLEEFTLKHMERRYYGSRALWNHSQFLTMISRSEARLRDLNLYSRLGGIALENFLPQLPHLTKLLISESNPVPSSIFDMMVKGEALQNLEGLECFVLSPIPFLRFLKYQCEFLATDQFNRLSSAFISYKEEPETTTEVSDWVDIYLALKPTLEKDAKVIVLTAL